MNKKVLHTIFEATAKENPNHIAIVDGVRQYSYSLLNSISNQLAHLLKMRGVERTNIIAVFVDDKVVQIASLLAAFKSGNIYLPLDVKYKQNHWEVLFTKLKPQFLIISENNLELFKQQNKRYEHTIIHVVSMVLSEKGLMEISTLNHETDSFEHTDFKNVLPNTTLEIAISGEDSNYIFFTSGSSGTPKAVLGNHKSLSHFIHWESNELKISEKDRIAQITSLSFDASLRDIFLAFFNGAKLYIPSNKIKQDPGLLKNWLVEHKISVVHTVPTMMRFLIKTDHVSSEQEYFESLDHLLLAGEKLYNRDIIAWREAFGNNATIYNLYGATESTLVKTIHKIEEPLKGPPTNPISVGKPISNTRILILNEQNHICEIGEVGNIYIQTPFLSKGYYNDELLTRQKFIPNPLPSNDDIIYVTGDYGKYDNERNIIVLGRKDGLVKINGVRCDLNSIEANVLKLEDVKMSKCLTYAVDGREQSIYCFYSAAKPINKKVKNHCLNALSEYELYSIQFIFIEEFPLNANGKLDTIALEDKLRLTTLKTRQIVLPGNKIERKLVKIWKEVLKQEQISITDNIFSLGGNSIQLTQISARIYQKLHVQLDAQDLYNNPKLKEQAVLIEDSKKSKYAHISSTEEQDHYPLSSAQFRLWLLSQFKEESVAYNMPSSIELYEKFDTSSFKKAILAVIDRHEILRTVFKEGEDGTIRQWIKKRSEIDFEISFRDLKNQNQNRLLAERLIAEDSYKPFDLENGPLLRVVLFQLSETTSIFYYNMHHIISDGWSIEILAKDVNAYYDAFQKGKNVNLPALKIQYKDYTVNQLEQLKSKVYDKHRRYWKNSLSGVLPLLDLPSTLKRPLLKTFNGRTIYNFFTADDTQSITTFAKKNDSSLFIVLLSALYTLFYRYTNQKDFIIGTPVAGREHLDLENQIGLYINTLALKNHVNPKENFKELFSRVKDNTFEAYKNQRYPFDSLLEAINIKKNLSRNPVFDIMVRFQTLFNKNEGTTLDEKEAEVFLDMGEDVSKFDMDISFKEQGNQIIFETIYNTDVYEHEMVENFMRHFKQLLIELVNSPEESLDTIIFLKDSQRQQILKIAHNLANEYIEPKTITALFAEQVKKKGEEVALEFNGHSYTYADLESRSEKLANYLVEVYDIAVEDIVGVCLQRSEWLIVSLLAILKAGAAYLPIDPNYPQERISYMQDDSGCNVIIDQEFIENYKPEQPKKLRPAIDLKPENLAYVIYTSGSTGSPKGVMVEHRNASVLLENLPNFGFEDNSIVAASTNLVFDIAFLEIFGTLCSGSTLILFTDEEFFYPEMFKQRLIDSKVEILQLTPSRFNQLTVGFLSHPKSCIRKLIIGGEVFPSQLFENRNNYEGISIMNVYGPTETTVWSTVSYITRTDILSIGKPLKGERCYVLSPNGLLLPAGVVGELFISGGGVSRGYLNNESLTQSKFLDNPFVKGERLYRTGDLVKQLPDGNLLYIGRTDEQIKINGHRVELEEIENALLRYDAISQSKVLLHTYDAESSLIGYIVGEEMKTNELQSNLLQILPRYMIPNYFVFLDAMPLTVNGKIDKKALLEIELHHSVENEYVAPRNSFEEKLINLCQDILKIEKISMLDNFLELGGDSIKLINLIQELRKMGLKITPEEVLVAKNLESIAELMSNSNSSLEGGLNEVSEMAETDTNAELAAYVQVSENQYYHLKSAHTIGISHFELEHYDEENFETQFRQFMSFFPSMCVKLKQDAGNILQKSISHTEVKLRMVSEKISKLNSKSQIENRMSSFFMNPFDICKEELIRVFVIAVPGSINTATIHFGIHHGITDYYSNQYLSIKATAFFNGVLPKEKIFSNFDIAKGQRKFLKTKQAYDQRVYWLGQFTPAFFKNTKQSSQNFSETFINQKLYILGEEFDLCNELCKRYKVPLNVLLMAVHNYILKTHNSHNGIQAILVDGREVDEFKSKGQEVIGVIDNILPIPFIKEEKVRFNKKIIRNLFSEYIEARINQKIPFETIRSEIKKKTEHDILDEIGGIYNFLQIDTKLSLSQSSGIELDTIQRKNIHGIHMKAFQYRNAVEINIAIPLNVYEKAEKSFLLTKLLPALLLNNKLKTT